MPIKLLHHKSFHPYKAENVARVKRDEAAAALQEQETDRRISLADSEARLDRMRSGGSGKSQKRQKREMEMRGEKAMERQLRGERLAEENDDDDDGETGTRIVRADDKGGSKNIVSGIETNGHLNFWADLEAGKTPPVDEAKLKKALEQKELESMTRMYIAKKGEGDPKGWYASADGKTERERRESVEATLERAYKDGEQKRLTDPLAQMNAYLARRHNILHGKEDSNLARASSSRYRERYLEPTTATATIGSDLSPVITSLLAPKRRRGEPIPPPAPVPPSSSFPASRSSISAAGTIQDPAAEAAARVSSERARAAALLADKKRKRAFASSPSSSASVASTPRSDFGGNNLFNAAETREAMERRRKAVVPKGGSGRVRLGWEEMRRMREARERGVGAGARNERDNGRT